MPAAMHLNFLAIRLYKFMLLPAKEVAFFSPLGTSRKQTELQLTLMWPDMRRFSQLLPDDIHRRTKLTSAVYGIQPLLQCAESEQCVATAY